MPQFETGWLQRPAHSCMDVLNAQREPFSHKGSVWRCECGKAYRVFGIATWRLRRFDAKVSG